VPELPDITVYVESLAAKVQGDVLQRLRLLNPFLLRTAVPPIGSVEGRHVVGVERLGKRVVIGLEGELFLVLHLMIAGRLKWLAAGAKTPAGKASLAVFEFGGGSLVFTEAGTTRRASLHLLRGRDALAASDPGGIDVLACTEADFAARLRSENHTVKRALTDPRLFSGIGNAYSDEILHRARLSPLLLTRKLDDAQIGTLLAAARSVLAEWTERLCAEAATKGWPDKVTAFRPEMAVHGRYGFPCPICAAPVQRILYANNETNYCARCQTGGKLLADRALSTLLKASWPRHIDELDVG
jgi:formamidopyrimidine-DNA glycosylase